MGRRKRGEGKKGEGKRRGEWRCQAPNISV